MFLAILLLVSQVLLHLFASSVVAAATADAASQLATADRGCGHGDGVAAELVRGRLGRFGETAAVQVVCVEQADGTIRVDVLARSPARALATERFGLRVGDIERTAVVRREEVVP